MSTSATLCAGSSRLVTPADLATLPVPQSLGPYHWPIPHTDVVEALHNEADGRGLAITREEWALSKDDARLFGVLEFGDGRPDTAWSMGIRNATDQSLALKGAAGTRTFVCDNLMLSGDVFVFSRKNTLRVNLTVIIKEGFTRYLDKQQAVDARWRVLSVCPMSDEAAKAFILDSFIEHKVAAVRYLPPVAQAYLNPAGVDTQPRTLAGLLNAYTRAFKDIKSQPLRWEASQRVARLFRI